MKLQLLEAMRSSQCFSIWWTTELRIAVRRKMMTNKMTKRCHNSSHNQRHNSPSLNTLHLRTTHPYRSDCHFNWTLMSWLE
jgi:hypothetical protein